MQKEIRLHVPQLLRRVTCGRTPALDPFLLLLLGDDFALHGLKSADAAFLPELQITLAMALRIISCTPYCAQIFNSVLAVSTIRKHFGCIMDAWRMPDVHA